MAFATRPREERGGSPHEQETSGLPMLHGFTEVKMTYIRINGRLDSGDKSLTDIRAHC
jgi:hypothetical protein